ncbi:hypothetical protein [Rhizobium sp. CCGE 510]|uniref:hypothetical protein n=1 Tax=Rhizobium sp. CCGE 510 TaxID=1132836 RepID=UPI00027B8E38|nr:hypothetical protein [Rhizobium sp. CCGE 510]EJT04621.1 hypothetical protein RCCGE510_13795 [Rhizobium sp. CCGE 510]
MVRRSRFALVILAFAAMATSAAADALPITGSYGNKDGCAYARSGESTGSDDFFLLTPEAITTAASSCEFKKVLKTEGKSFTATVSCQEEGEENGTGYTAKLTFGQKGYIVTFTDDAAIHWGPMPLCK